MARDVESLLRQQAALAAFGSFAFQETDLDTILMEAARICAGSFGVNYCKICRYRPAENEMVIEAGFGWQQGVIGTIVRPVDESTPQGRAFVTGQPVIVRNLWDANGYKPPAFYAAHDIVSTVDVLIKAHAGQPFGVLEVDSAVQRVYDSHDIDFLTGFANVLAEAVATADRNEALRASLSNMTALVAEKDRLLSERNLLAMELQHRVRNNLQIVNNMVTAQLRVTTNEEARTGLRGITRQIMSIAEVHEHLLGAGMDGRIHFGTYAERLCANLPDVQSKPPFPIVLRCTAEPLMVSLASATALGLVITELVSNSYGHAFPGRPGTIDVHVRRADPVRSDVADAGPREQGVVTVKDDGIGYVPAADTRRHGMGLVRRLMEQIEGSLEVTGGAGTTWTLRFPALPPERPTVA